MPFNNQSRLDPSQVSDRRGRGMSPVALGGGGLGLIVLIVALLMGVNPGDLSNIVLQQPQQIPNTGSAEANTLAQECQTGADANTRQDCRIVGYVNSIQVFWNDEFARLGGNYTEAETVLFTQAVQTGCGPAGSGVGPFYCPADQKVYLDLEFFNQLQSRFGAQGGPFAEAYVLAHEYGHHVQNLTGLFDTMGGSRSTGPESEAVLTELQADCLAGVWAFHAAETGYLTPVTDQEIAQSLDAAASVGDDRIQRQTQGYITPESWTHGSSQQRQQALKDGLHSGDIQTCTTPGW